MIAAGFARMMSMIFALLSFFMDTIWMGNNRWNPLSVEPYTIAPDVLLHMKNAMNASYQVAALGVINTTDTQTLESAVDKVIVDYRDGACYAAWVGAHVVDMEDSMQSIPGIFSTKVCGAKGCCRMETGIVGAYEVEYVEEFEASVDRCYNRCPGGCPLIISGHSQGATIGVVAAVKLSKYDPILITFGQHRVHRYSCDVLDNMDTYLRVVSVADNGGSPIYDINAQLGSLVGRHTGTMIMVGEGGATTLGYNSDMWFFPMSDKAHGILDPYSSSVQKLEPGLLDGFVAGSLCSRHIECKSRSCSRHRCT